MDMLLFACIQTSIVEHIKWHEYTMNYNGLRVKHVMWAHGLFDPLIRQKKAT